MFLALNLIAMGMMGFALWQLLRLRALIPGGVIGRQWVRLTALVVLFLAGYLSGFFLDLLPPEQLKLVIGFIFVGGAGYVLITVALVKRIAEELLNG